MCSWCKILVPVSGEQASSCAGPLSGAFTLAKRFGAQVEGVYLAETLEVPAGDYFPAGASHAQGGTATLERPAVGNADRALAAFSIYSRQFPEVQATLTGLDGELGLSLARHARLADVTVVGNAGWYQTEFWQAAREAALFESGRPVLVVPTGEIIESAGETLLIAWKDDAAAARALATALPLIAKARYICVMAIGEESKVGASLRAAHRYLRLHNPDVYIELVEARDRLAGELLLAKADLWDDVILLMGAYGHSRLRERVTGGVMEYILQHTTAPVLMAH